MNLFAMYFLYAAAVSAFLLGALLLFFPKALAKINEVTSKLIVGTEQYMFAYRVIAGIILLIFGLFVVYVLRTTPLKL
ncbi:MAG TPA: hypothetical protein DHV16_08005 [Nitrospiraceae bacterium]|nr:MAG: hypothetical protein A2Z82_06810 [Nitrospirae bacterium GWA2_46_11]OGW24731.1 MAG: hypothetical protein A2X55_06885 [Nitrospirae bacterium GWB2_47_37]HAK88464.1 hypothetical protein [Nitrospiraceae bacterium]HCL81060.1 hypothetical protein [Nitrospiraceae bacterium]HCZ12179.1 hypothetical protein [Nitrospiraceae bacterium]